MQPSVFAPNRRQLIRPNTRMAPELSREVELAAAAHLPASFGGGGEVGAPMRVDVGKWRGFIGRGEAGSLGEDDVGVSVHEVADLAEWKY